MDCGGLQVVAAERSDGTRDSTRHNTSEPRPDLVAGATDIIIGRVPDQLLVSQIPTVSSGHGLLPPHRRPTAFDHAAIDFQPHPGSDARFVAHGTEPWFFNHYAIGPVCRDVARRLQMVVDLLRCYRVGSKVPSPDGDGRILALGGSPLVKFDHEEPHGTIRGACIVEGGTVSGADFKLRLSRVKKSSFRAQIAPNVSSPSWELQQVHDARNFALVRQRCW
eukprot:COSAG01_NODE_4136_length_5308_cov_65.001728_8_plen_221_part_00